MASTLETAGGIVGSAVVNAAAVAAAIVILRSGRASDPKLLAGAFAFYAATKESGKLNGELFGRKLDELLKQEFDIDIDEILEDQFKQNIMPVLEEYFDYVDTWDDWLDFIDDSTTSSSQDFPTMDDLINFDPNDPNNSDPNDGNNLNTDSDGDGIPDHLDPYPNDASPDSDGDGIPDHSDAFPDDPNNGNGHQPPYDPTTPGMSDPLVLDTDKDGFISTISLEDSTAYFDLTGDGVKEKVGWISPNDGILAYDKDGDGKISGIDEVFGSGKVSGFTELRELADSNHDGVIDRRDELFSRLQVWHDKNGDGISQADELVSLKEEGVTSINLNAVSTNIEINGNLLTEASKYTDSEGNLELAADIELQYVEKVNSNPIATDEFEIDPATYDLSNLRGYGYVDDAFTVYNLDEDFKIFAQDYAIDIQKVATNFEEFIAHWSGFYEMAEGRGISKDEFSPNVLEVPAIKIWILERFAGANVDKWRTEAHLSSNTGGGYHNTSYANEQYIHDSFNKLIEQYESKFAIETFYADVFSDTHYDLGKDEFVIDDENAFYSKVTDYLNNTDIDVKERLYLAQVMNMQEGVFLHFDAQTIVDSIEDTQLQTTISDIYSDKIHFEYMREDGHYRYENSLVYANETDDLITLETKQTTTVIADKGDDIIIDNAGGNTTYIYRKGNGSDVVFYEVGLNRFEFIVSNSLDFNMDRREVV